VRVKTPEQSDKILAAAARLFGTQQFHEVRMEDIAADAEVGKGTLYRYFQDKDELFAALLDDTAAQLRERIEQSIRAIVEPVARMEALVETIIGFFDNHPHLFDLIQRGEVMQGPAFTWRKTRQELQELLVALFEEAKIRGDFTFRDMNLASLMLLGSLRSVIRFGERPRPRHLARRMVESFLAGADKLSRPLRSRLRGERAVPQRT
jgi:TetR/AcrR family fatty acid metabolism transcriptional regulator